MRKTYARESGTKRVWRCTKRNDNCKWCPDSPTLSETELQQAILEVINDNKDETLELIQLLRTQLEAVVGVKAIGFKGVELQIKISKLQEACDEMISNIRFDDDCNVNNFDDELFEKMMLEKNEAEEELQKLLEDSNEASISESRLDMIVEIMDAMKNHPMEWVDEEIRQLIDKIIVEGPNRIRIITIGGTEIEKEW